MADGWWVLTRRWGGDMRSPTDAQLQSALDELFSSKDPEHPNTWLRFGRDEGPLFVLDVYEDGSIHFEEWADAECEQEIAPTRRLAGASLPVALGLWQALRRGDVSAVRAAAWT